MTIKPRVLRRLYLGALAGIIICFPAFAERFTDPLFESLNRVALRAEFERLSAVQTRNEAEQLRWLQTGYFLSEAEGFAESIHEQFALLHSLDETCGVLSAESFVRFRSPAEKAQAAFTCALVVSERLSRAIQFTKPAYAARVHALMALGNAAQGENEDRLYAEGRIYYRLSAAHGGRVGKSLLSLQILRRLRPEASSLAFWTGHVYLKQGNEDKARSNFEVAFEKNDPRAIAYFNGRRFVRNPVHLDGLSWGFRPALFFSPVAGFGGALNYHDDRMWDKKREGEFGLLASTQGSFGAALSFRDRQTLGGAQIGLDLRFGVFNHEFYGLGLQTQATSRSVFKSQEFTGKLGLRQAFLDYLFLEIGWVFEAHNVRDVSGASFQNAALTDKNQSFGTGPFGRLGVDSRDSRRNPRRGFYSFVQGEFPTRDLGSNRSFERWHVQAEWHEALGLSHGLHVLLGASWLRGEAPYAWYPRLRGTFNLPGVRRDRFQDKAAVLLTAEYKYRLWEPLSLVGFGMAGRVDATPGGLFAFPYTLGAGIAAEFHASDLYSPSVRLELGVFGRETVVQAVGSASL